MVLSRFCLLGLSFLIHEWAQVCRCGGCALGSLESRVCGCWVTLHPVPPPSKVPVPRSPWLWLHLTTQLCHCGIHASASLSVKGGRDANVTGRKCPCQPPKGGFEDFLGSCKGPLPVDHPGPVVGPPDPGHRRLRVTHQASEGRGGSHSLGAGTVLWPQSDTAYWYHHPTPCLVHCRPALRAYKQMNERVEEEGLPPPQLRFYPARGSYREGIPMSSPMAWPQPRGLSLREIFSVG